MGCGWRRLVKWGEKRRVMHRLVGKRNGNSFIILKIGAYQKKRKGTSWLCFRTVGIKHVWVKGTEISWMKILLNSLSSKLSLPTVSVCQAVLVHLKQPRDTLSESIHPWIWSHRGTISPASETQPLLHETRLLFNSSEQQAESRKWRIMSPLETANYTCVDIVLNFPVIIGYTVLCVLLVLRFSSGFILGCSLCYAEMWENLFQHQLHPAFL